VRPTRAPAIVAAVGVTLGVLAPHSSAAECLFLADGSVEEGTNIRSEGEWVKYDPGPSVTVGVPRAEVRRIGPCPAAPPRFALVRAESYAEATPRGPTRGVRVHVVPEDWGRTDETALLVAGDWPGLPVVVVFFWPSAEEVGTGSPRYAVEVRGGAVTRVLTDRR
jgi:hypothetical protein